MLIKLVSQIIIPEMGSILSEYTMQVFLCETKKKLMREQWLYLSNPFVTNRVW